MGKHDAAETHQPLQAVVMADSFTQPFRPITIQRPKVLLPLVNVPMLNYTLEWLASAGVEEAFVFCCAHAAQVQEYLETSGWLAVRSFAVHVLVSQDCKSPGDALRVVDQRNVVRSDFVLVSGDVVSNMALAPALAAHRARRKTDKQVLMTMVTKRVSTRQRLQRLGDPELVVALDHDTHQLLAYEEKPTSPQAHVRLEAQMLKGRRAVQLRADLMDCHIAICAPEVLVDFRENFDYQQLRRDFVGGVLIDEAMGNKIFVHELAPAEYAARVHHLRAYDAISRDIIHRWVYPFVPDNSIVPALKSTPGYVYARGNMYRHLTAGPDGGAGIARSAVVGRDTVVGAACTVGEHTQLHSCVIGAGCVIGANCKLEGCYLDAGVTVGDGCVLTSAMVLGGAMLHPNATLEEGVILSYNVVVGAGHTVKAHTRLSLRKQEDFEEYDDSDEELEVSGPSLAGKADAGKVPEAGGLSVALDRANLSAAKAGMTAPRSNMQWDATVVGHGGAGYVWVPRGAEPRAGEEGDTDSAEQQDEIARYSIVARARAADAVIRWESDDEDEVPRAGKGKGNAASACDKGESESDEDDFDPEMLFRREVTETFLRCVRMRYDQGNAVVELNALKLAEDRTFADLSRYILTALLALALPPTPEVSEENVVLYAMPGEEPSDKELLLALKRRLDTWGPLLQRFLKDKDDQVELLLTIEEMCMEEGVFAGSGGARYTKVFVQLLQLLYNCDVLSEEAVLTWAKEKESASEEDQQFTVLAAPFIRWLQEAEEEDSSDESD